MRTIEEILADNQTSLHKEQYPTDDVDYRKHINELEGDYFPLHMVKTACREYLKDSLNQLFLESEHGDQDHRQWLRSKFTDFYESQTQGLSSL